MHGNGKYITATNMLEKECGEMAIDYIGLKSIKKNKIMIKKTFLIII